MWSGAQWCWCWSRVAAGKRNIRGIRLEEKENCACLKWVIHALTPKEAQLCAWFPKVQMQTKGLIYSVALGAENVGSFHLPG
jgi:hypothetical protein